MNLPDWLNAAILGVVEGLTEFLPISSTGHLILAGDVLRYDSELFIVVIQLGALAAVWWIYRRRIIDMLSCRTPENRRVCLNVFIAFLPAALVGALLHKWIVAYLFNPVTVGITLIVGGIAIFPIEKKLYHPSEETLETMSPHRALLVGCAQCFALIPGVSRSGATILGGITCGLSRPVATEFSFLLALPIMLGASVYEMFKYRNHLSDAPHIIEIGIGLIVSYVSAWIVVKWLIRYVQTHTFIPFAWYRIAFGTAVLACAYTGVLS
jgi:undecaprenyl-diphosphatase